MLQIIELLVYDSEDIETKFLKTIKRWRGKYKTTPTATNVKQKFHNFDYNRIYQINLLALF